MRDERNDSADYFDRMADEYEAYAEQWYDFPLKHEANLSEARKYRSVAAGIRRQIEED